MEAPPIVDWKSAHPLLRYAGFRQRAGGARASPPRRPPGPCRWWIRRRRPLILAGELGRQRIIWIGFDILESNWPLRVSFPIFIANAVEWLNPANARSGQLLVKAGDPFRLALAEPATSAQVTLPGGATKSLKLDPTANELVFGDTYKAGHLSAAPGDE